MRRKRVTIVAAASLTALALAWPVATPGSVLVFMVLMLTVHWPSRQKRLRLAEPPAPADPVWPGRGMKAAVEALQEPALIVDRDMLIRYRNPSSAIAFGNMALGDAVSLRFRSPELLSAIEAAMADAMVHSATLEEKRPVERHWGVEILPIPAFQGEKPHFFLVLFHDRTAERRVERMRTDFVANASHELRTPLASLTGFIETLQGPARDDPKAREQFLPIMREQAMRMSRLIDDLLSLSRVEMKRHVPVNTKADLVTVMNKVASQIEPVAKEIGVALIFEGPETSAIVEGDEDELIQVFSNLVENACKYGPEGGRIELSVKRASERGEAVIDASVRDFGPGIPAEHVPRLTERFYRIDVGNSRSKRGTGLGLSIVRNILLRHKSRLIVESTLGQGSVFTARFPVSGGQETNSAESRKLPFDSMA
ncbi:ATP-binding protein [Jiella marina]|uniref:ATP-binding protein n=1 Tax=Jiella sp. LLJ827 TaxID=2917712 RepID=UPI0021016CED|nr:ATP-binding protein [Jiella sp. LLJ827]MCQ0989377.1 ATP-binding protein [Jiella sp. LLJ827]